MLPKLQALLWRVRYFIVATMLLTVSVTIILKVTAPTLNNIFSSDQFHHHHDDVWAIEYNPKLPFWWYLPKLDSDIPTISTARFTENGEYFGRANEYFWREGAVKSPQVKYWSFIRSKGKMREIGLTTPNMIYLAMGSNEDPRLNGKTYAITAKAHVARSVLDGAKFILGLGILLLIFGLPLKSLFTDFVNILNRLLPKLVTNFIQNKIKLVSLGQFFYRNAGYIAVISGLIFAGWLYLMLTPPMISHKFTAMGIYPMQKNAWVAGFEAEIPPSRMIKTNDYINRIKSENDFRENGQLFTQPNSECVLDFPSRDLQIKCWDYATKNDLLYLTTVAPGEEKSGLRFFLENKSHSENIYYVIFRLPLGEDPRLNGKTYGVNANLVLSKNLTLAILAFCLFLLLPMVLRYSNRGGHFHTRLTFCAFAGAIGIVTLTTVFYGGIFQLSPSHLPDSFGYTSLNLYRPVGTWLFFNVLKLLGDFDKLLIPTQYFLMVGSFACLFWAFGSLIKKYWLSLFLLIFSFSELISISYSTDIWSDLIYLVLSEPLFLSCFALSLSCFYLLLQNNTPRSQLFAALGMGLFLVLADITRAIGLAFFVMIPLYAMWHLYAQRHWRETAKHIICMVVPIFIVLFGQSAFQRIHYGKWGAGGGGCGVMFINSIGRHYIARTRRCIAGTRFTGRPRSKTISNKSGRTG